MNIVPIARMQNGFAEKFGIPRQSGLADTKGRIIFEPAYRNQEALRGLDGYSHIWILWEFSESIRETWSPTVRPPRLGGNTRVGVFATRSPFRPNPIGMSVVKLEYIEWNTKEGAVLHVTGADLMNDTPIYDIKPYLPHIDSKPEAEGGFAEAVKDDSLKVILPEKQRGILTKEEEQLLVQILSQDPRPSYHQDTTRIYGMKYEGYEIKFQILCGAVTVVSIEKDEKKK